MKRLLLPYVLASSFIFYGCSNGQPAETSLQPSEFAEMIYQTPEAYVIDVRTPQEYEQGHLVNALNYDWNGGNFQQQIATLDKSRPVFVYCLSGGRSASAATSMRSQGFSPVFEMKGGMMQWRTAQLPETSSANPRPPGMSRDQFNALVASEKKLLVDFYADWCEPCQRMKPYLEEIARDMSGQLKVLRINVDDNRQLTKDLKLDGLPVLQLYKDKSLAWSHTGFIGKDSVVMELQ